MHIISFSGPINYTTKDQIKRTMESDNKGKIDLSVGVAISSKT